MDKKKKIILLALVAVAAYFIFTKLGKKSDAGESGDETESADGTGDGEEAAGNTSGSSGSTPAKNEWWDKYEPARKLIDKNQPIYIFNLTGTKNFFIGEPVTVKLAHLNGEGKRYMEVMKMQTAHIRSIAVVAAGTNEEYQSSMLSGIAVQKGRVYAETDDLRKKDIYKLTGGRFDKQVLRIPRVRPLCFEYFRSLQGKFRSRIGKRQRQISLAGSRLRSRRFVVVVNQLHLVETPVPEPIQKFPGQ